MAQHNKSVFESCGRSHYYGNTFRNSDSNFLQTRIPLSKFQTFLKASKVSHVCNLIV